MTVRIWASDVSAWEGGAPTTSTSTSTSPPLPSRRELARIRTQHRSNVFQAFFVDAGDEGSDLLTCAADGAVRSLSVPRAQCDRLFPRSSSSSARGCDGSGAAGGSATVVESRCLFKHCGRAHKMALVPGSPHEFATCGEDGVVATFDLRERGRGGGRGIGRGSGGGSSSPSPLTAAVGPAALAAAARVPGRSCFPPSDRGCSRAQPASSSAINVNVTLYSVSFDSQRPWLLAVGGDANELGLGELPAALVIDRRMLSIPPSEAFNRFDDDDESGSGTDPTAGTIFARGSLFRELLDSSSMAGRMALGTLDEARVSLLFLSRFCSKRGRGRSRSHESLNERRRTHNINFLLKHSFLPSAPPSSRAQPCPRTWARSAAALAPRRAAPLAATRGSARAALP